MTCNEIENQLPAYLEDLLSPEEKEAVAGHLAACDRCGRALAELEQAGKLVRELGEVEPPAFFEQRIMSRVREESAGKPGILRRLFFPLHSKIPVPALATIVVAVLAYHVYQQGGPETKQMAPPPAPITAQGTGRVETLPPTVQVTPPVARPSRVPAPAGDLAAAKPEPYTALPPDKRGSAEMTADSRTPTRHGGPTATLEAPVMAAKGKDARTSREEVPGMARDQAGREESARASGTFAPELKREKTADAGAASGDARKTAAAPAPARMKAATIQPSAVDLMIQVRDPAAALRELESSLARVNARIVERQSRSGSEFWRVEMAAQSLPQLLSLLEGIGRVSPKMDASAVPPGTVTLGITVVALP